MEALELVRIAANALNKKKAREIAAIKIDNLTVFSEYFIICSASSTTQMRALCDEVEEQLEILGVRPHHIEGKTTGWIALDYGSVIIHIFTKTEREFYSLDKMWSDGVMLDMNEILDEAEGD